VAVRVWTTVVLVVTLLGSGGGAHALGDKTAHWWPGGTVIVVRDYTPEKEFSNVVESRVARWALLLPGGSTMIYAREPYAPCDEILIGTNIDGILLGTIPANEIWVCQQQKVGGAYGETMLGTHPDGAIRNAFIRVAKHNAGRLQERKSTVCHELGHALGVTHSTSAKSCVARYGTRPSPGAWDAATLRKSFRDE
jgi:hypothetical protein